MALSDEQLWAEMYSPEFRRAWEAAVLIHAGSPIYGYDLARLRHRQGFWPTIALRALWLMQQQLSDTELDALVSAERRQPAAPINATSTAKTRAENTARLLAALSGDP